jgi:hypothetical protein
VYAQFFGFIWTLIILVFQHVTNVISLGTNILFIRKAQQQYRKSTVHRVGDRRERPGKGEGRQRKI